MNPTDVIFRNFYVRNSHLVTQFPHIWSDFPIRPFRPGLTHDGLQMNQIAMPPKLGRSFATELTLPPVFHWVRVSFAQNKNTPSKTPSEIQKPHPPPDHNVGNRHNLVIGCTFLNPLLFEIAHHNYVRLLFSL